MPSARGARNRSLDATPGAMPFALFCIFVVSYLLHLGSRIPVLGVVHFDMLIGAFALITASLSTARADRSGGGIATWSPASRWLLFLVLFIVFSLPFVKWPGSVVRHGLEPFAKALFFFVLTVMTVNTPRRLMVFVWLFVTCQVFRVLEPLFLHVTVGYWGATTHLGNWVFMDRLSGAPSDVVNPNGLAFIVVTSIPFLHFVIARSSKVGLAIYIAVVPMMIWTLLLTGSRSGLIVLLVVALLIVIRSKSKVFTAVVVAAASVAGVVHLSGLQQERYESIVSKDVGGAETFQGRIDGVIGDFKGALERPIFGHGLGTSVEVNAHVRGIAQLSHNLITEAAQELGFVGLAIFVMFLFKAFQSSRDARRGLANLTNADGLLNVSEALIVTMVVSAIFALASYGLSEFYWYLWSGLCVTIGNISNLVVGQFGSALVVAAPSQALGQAGRARPSTRRRSASRT